MRQSKEDTPRAHIKGAIVRMILSRGYKVGDKLPSYEELATHFDVCARTIVRAVHELAEEGTVQLLQGKGVYVRKMPRGRGKLTTVGLAYPASQLALLHESYLNQILSGVISLCAFNEIDLQIVAFRRRKDYVPVPPRELALRADGMILLGILNDRYIAECAREAILLVLVDSQTQAARIPCVAADNAQAVNLVMDHLHGLGHRRIAYVDFRSWDDLARGSESAWLDTADTRERREAYLAALQRLRLDYVRIYPPVQVARPIQAPPAAGVAALAALRKDEHPPTAIVCYDVGIAFFLCQALQDGGQRVPHDISVAAAGGAKGSILVGSQLITCTLIDFEEMGKHAILALQRQTKRGSKASPQVERIGGTLYVGTTTGEPGRL